MHTRATGTFHADDALAAALLRVLPQYAHAELRRSRDPKDWDEATVVFDVSGEYDAERGRFDHHQRGFDHVFGHGFNTKLSSAGLIYKLRSPFLLGGRLLLRTVLLTRPR